MKILYIDQSGQLGGAEFSLLDWLRRSPADAHVLLFEHGPFVDLLKQNGVSVEVLPLGAARAIRRESGVSTIVAGLSAIWKLRTRVAKRADSYDMLYANSQKAFLIAALACKRRQKLVWHLRDILTAEHFSGVLRRIVVAVANRSADLIIANSQATRDSFVTAGGDASKVRVVYPGISSKKFDAVTTDEAISLRKEICPDANFVVGIFGRLSDWKGQHILLQAMASLPGYHTVIVGDALFGEQAYKDQLLQRAAETDLRGRVHFLGFRRDIPVIMKAIDVPVHASVAPEPFGRVIVEGMLAGKPVIATRAGGAAEILEDKITGLLVRPGSVEEMREAIMTLAADRDLYNKVASAGRKHAEEVFSVEALIHNTAAALGTIEVSFAGHYRDAAR